MSSEAIPAATVVLTIQQPVADYAAASTARRAARAEALTARDRGAQAKGTKATADAATARLAAANPALAANLATAAATPQTTHNPLAPTVASSASARSPALHRVGEKTPLLVAPARLPGDGPNSPGVLRRDYVLPAPPQVELSLVFAKVDAAANKAKIGRAESAADEDGEEAGSDKDAKFLALLFGVYVFVALGNRLFQKLQTIPMYNYPMFLNLLSTVVFVPASFAYIFPMVSVVCGAARRTVTRTAQLELELPSRFRSKNCICGVRFPEE
jgi:hypothetical protein